jgi:hypothetical protein
MRVDGEAETPPVIKKENVKRLEDIKAKLREAARAAK